MTTPHFEVTKHRNVDNRIILTATIHGGNDMVPFLVHDSVNKMQTAFDTDKQFLERIRAWGKVLDIEVEENF